MPNIFGPGGSSLAVPLYDARLVRQHRQRFHRDMVPELEYANSLYIPSGRWPARGWVLLRRADLNQLPNLYATNFQLSIEDMKRITPQASLSSGLTFKNLSIVQARCVSRGKADNPDALYLVELTDPRGILCNRWFEYPTTSQYNLRAPAYDTQFYDGSLNVGVRWTWDGLLQDLWNQMGAFLGAYPGLPAAPVDIPEGWSFTGCSAWRALNVMLDLLGFTVACDLTKAAPYTIVNSGTADLALDALQAHFAGLLEDDMDWIDVGAARVPKQIVVYFRRRNQFYGTEETVRRDSLQWQTNYFYSVTVPAPANFSAAAGTGYYWSDFTVRYDVDNNPLAADVATAATVAAAETLAYYSRIYSQTFGFLWQLYSGALPFVTGSLVDGVCYREDFRQHHDRQGWLTEIVRGPEPPWEMVGDDYD